MKEWCKQEDQRYIDYLKQQITYFNDRLVIRSMEGSEIRHSIHDIIELIEIDLGECEEKYRRDYGNQSGKCIFKELEECITGEDGSSKASDHLVTNDESADTRTTSG